MTPKPSLRARKKLKTWETIASTAWNLFFKQGYERTTLEQIAEAADIHKQTVLRYFQTKEDIALAYHKKTLEAFEKGLHDTNRKEDVITYWRSHVQRAARSVSESHGLTRSNRIIHENPKLFAHYLALDRKYQELLISAFAAEAGVQPDDLQSTLLGAFLVAGNNAVARKVLARRKFDELEKACLSVVDFAIKRFPQRKAVARRETDGESAAARRKTYDYVV